MADQKLSQKTTTTSVTGGYIHIILPNGATFISRRLLLANILADYMTTGTYDPNAIAADVFDPANQVYDNSVSGLTAEDVQNAIDELASEIAAIGAGYFNLASNNTDDISESETLTFVRKAKHEVVNADLNVADNYSIAYSHSYNTEDVDFIIIDPDGNWINPTGIAEVLDADNYKFIFNAPINGTWRLTALFY